MGERNRQSAAPGRVAALMAAAALAIALAPAPALAETGGETALCVSAQEGSGRRQGDSEAEQSHRSVASKASTQPATGDHTLTPIAAVASGATALAAGAASRRCPDRRRNEAADEGERS